MAALNVIRAGGYGLLTNRLARRTSKCMFQRLGFLSETSRSCSSFEKYGKGIQRLLLLGKTDVGGFVSRLQYFSTNPAGKVVGPNLNHKEFTDKKTLTEEDPDHDFISIIGKEEQNIDRLRMETGLDFELNPTKTGLIVSGSDDKGLKRATEKETQEVQGIRNQIKKVSTDEDADIHDEICRCIFGKGGQNIERLRLETGLYFELYSTKTALLVHGSDVEGLQRATEKVTQEIQGIRSQIEKVSTDEDSDIHHHIFGCIIGKEGQNIERLRLETGLDFKLYSTKTLTALLVCATDAEGLKRATEKVTQEVQRIRNQTEKVSTDEDADIHDFICRVIIGKRRQNLQRLRLETGLDFKLYSTKTALLVCATDAEGLKRATEKVTQEIQGIRNQIEKVSTDEDSDIHDHIYGYIIGKGGQNLERLRLETGLDFELDSIKTALLVSWTDAEALKRATEKVTQEVQRIRNQIEKVSTDEDSDIHHHIFGSIIGKGGQNIKRLRLETGLGFLLTGNSTNTALLVSWTDAEGLKRATEKVTQEVQRIRNQTEKVSTDEDSDIHHHIFGSIIGKGGQNIERLRLETGLGFLLTGNSIKTALLVSWSDAEGLKRATEKVTQEVQRIRNQIEKVSTDEDADIHDFICGVIVGKGGQNLQILKMETGLDFELLPTQTGLIVCCNDGEVLRSVVEKVTQKVQFIKNCIH